MVQSLTLEDEIVATLRRIIRGVDLHSRHLVQESGLTWPQLAVLRAADRLGPCCLSALARAVHLGQATLSGVIRRLERAGLVERTPHETDRRSVNIRVTSSGRQRLATAPSLLHERFKAELAGLREWERHQMLALLMRIAEMMDVESLDASPMLGAGPVDPGEAGPDAYAEAPVVARGKRTRVRGGHP